MLRVAVVLVYSSGLGWVRVAIDEPSDEPLRKGETQRAKPSVSNFYTSVDSHVDTTKCDYLCLKYTHAPPGLIVAYAVAVRPDRRLSQHIDIKSRWAGTRSRNQQLRGPDHEPVY